MNKKSYRRRLILILTPLIIFILLIIGYLVYDPLKVLRTYDSYSIAEINLNRDYISTETFLNHYEQEGYNSFIFGSSRTMGYNPQTWKKYLQEDAKTYSFDAYSENLFGISRKLILLDTMNVSIENVMILIDPDSTFFITHNTSDPLSRKHPVLLGNDQSDRIAFQMSQFGAYIKMNFFVPYYLNKIGIGGKLGNMHKSKRIVHISYPDNWMNSPEWLEQTEEENYYYNSEFKRNSNKEVYLQSYIHEEQKVLLEEIKGVLNKNNTNYKIVINPLYNLHRLNQEDIKILEDFFGEEDVYDFSGKNDFTFSEYNYFDQFHFKPQVGDSIFASIYKTETPIVNAH